MDGEDTIGQAGGPGHPLRGGWTSPTWWLDIPYMVAGHHSLVVMLKKEVKMVHKMIHKT